MHHFFYRLQYGKRRVTISFLSINNILYYLKKRMVTRGNSLKSILKPTSKMVTRFGNLNFRGNSWHGSYRDHKVLIYSGHPRIIGIVSILAVAYKLLSIVQFFPSLMLEFCLFCELHFELHVQSFISGEFPRICFLSTIVVFKGKVTIFSTDFSMEATSYHFFFYK